MGIGVFQADDNKSHSHPISRYTVNHQSGFFVNMTGGYVGSAIMGDLGNIFFNNSGGPEAKPASISAYICIKY
jgi:hypothetical protein